MSIALRQATASQEVPLGFFLDSLDGNSEETGLTIASTDIKLWKFGATALVDCSVGATHMGNGVYVVVLGTEDTDIVGTMVVFVHISGALTVRLECQVYEEAVYDSLLAASAAGYLQPTIAGRTLDVTATGAAGIDWGNVENPTTVVGLSNTEVGTVSTVVDAIKAKTDNLPSDPADQSAVEAAISAAAANLATAASLATVDTVVDAIKAKTDNLPSDPADQSAVEAAISAAAANLATAASLATVDTVVDAIKAKTDNLPATPAAVGSAMTLATNSVTAAALAADAVDEILDEVVEDDITVRGALRALLALWCKNTTVGSVLTFRNPGDTKNRVTLNVDDDGNHTAVTFDLT